MKKALVAATLIALASGTASAATILLGSTPQTQLNIANCPNHLATDVSITPSANVKLGFNCVAANTTLIRLATCHTAGQTKSRTERVVCSTANPLPNGVPACAAQGSSTYGDGTSYNIGTAATGSAFYTASTGGGSMGASALNGDTCSAADATTFGNKIPD